MHVPYSKLKKSRRTTKFVLYWMKKNSKRYFPDAHLSGGFKRAGLLLVFDGVEHYRSGRKAI